MGTTTAVAVEALVDPEVKAEDQATEDPVDGEALVDPQGRGRYVDLFFAHVSRITTQGRSTMVKAIHILYKIHRLVFLVLKMEIDFLGQTVWGSSGPDGPRGSDGYAGSWGTSGSDGSNGYNGHDGNFGFRIVDARVWFRRFLIS